jgi:hypothetical protein
MEMKQWYVVYEGRIPGAYDEWGHGLKQVNKFKDNNYKGYKSKEEAEARYMKHLLGEDRKKKRMKTLIIIPILLIMIAFSVVCDCSLDDELSTFFLNLAG